ncbi:helix-turn-helix domain-containing protein [Halobacteria archaeon AArc-dxtr1]|nr:helix-turn-helix domain-containing protein [Halobacteria archaeon AArc-dxtr1]
MSDDPQQYAVVLVTRQQRSSLPRQFEDAEGITLKATVEPPKLEATVECYEPDGVVLELDEPPLVRTAIQQVASAHPEAATVLTPSEGGERLATVALRIGVTDYVPPESPTTAANRTATVLDSKSSQSPEETGNADPESVDDETGYRQLFETRLPDKAFLIAEDGTYLDTQIRPESVEPYDNLVGRTIHDVFSADRADRFQRCIERAIEEGTVQSIEYELEMASSPRQSEGRVLALDGKIDGQRAVVWLARDVTERVERERRLQSRRDELQVLGEIHAVVRQVIGTLVAAPTQAAIEQNVCDGLVESELYCSAIVSEINGEGGITYRVGAGGDDEELAELVDRGFDYETVLETSESETISEASSSIRALQESAIGREHEIQSAIAIPLCHEEIVYGVLTVYTDREAAFGPTESDSFQILGETIGFAIAAVRSRRLLFADSVVELELRIDGGDSFSFDITTEYECTCSLEWVGKDDEGTAYQYVTIDGLDGETALAEAEAHDSVQSCRLIHDADDHCTIEMQLVESGVRTLMNLGVTIRDVTIEDGVGRCLVEVAQDTDIREILDQFSQVYERSELVARRDVDRPVQTAAERRNRILDRVTDRQLTALRLAYYGGYFNWPRDSTGEEIAEVMGISPPTMHQHLRKALYEILTEFFDENTGTKE